MSELQKIPCARGVNGDYAYSEDIEPTLYTISSTSAEVNNFSALITRMTNDRCKYVLFD